MSKCQICGGVLPAYFKGDICSDACRAKKARMKRDAGVIGMRIQRDLLTLTKTAQLGIIERETAILNWNDLNAKLNDLYEAITKLEYQK